MPAAPITSAARLIANPAFKSGWGAVLTPEVNDVVRSVRTEASGMYQLQTARDGPVLAVSMYTALFWEARKFRNLSKVFTPAITDELQLFLEKGEGCDAARAVIRKKASDNIEDAQFHPLLKSMRDYKFTIWPVHLPTQNVWVTVILQIREISKDIQGSSRYDREVVACAIVDPYPCMRDDRRDFIKRRLSEILEEGCIRLPDSAVAGSFTTEDVQDTWATGHVAYAVCREFIRRLKVLNYKEDCGHTVNTDLLWSPFEQHHDVDSYRESMMAACAHRTIQNSNYLVRMALEVPSKKSNHEPNRLNALLVDRNDEWFTKPKTKSPRKVNVKVSVQEENEAVAPLTPRSEHGSYVSQPSDLEDYDDEDEDEDTDAELEVGVEAQAYPLSPAFLNGPTQPMTMARDIPMKMSVVESIEEEPLNLGLVRVEDHEDLQDQGDIQLDHCTKERSRETTPAKRCADDAEEPAAKRVKIEDAE
ncbi:hypothetical protein F4774DRAFT_426619 [Daldinia eschscholtzii]|nr:hypothetical protein F4774DRAFT_426619 [Daldinia eschscholtzii]